MRLGLWRAAHRTHYARALHDMPDAAAAYFQPVIEELLKHPVAGGYLQYLRLKLRGIADNPVPAKVQKTTFSEGKLAGGWSVSAIESLQSGFPFTPQLGYNPTNNGDSRDPIRPSWNPAFSGPVVLGSPNQYFNPNAFVTPASGTYGNVGRDPLIGPSMAELDFSLLKNTPVFERSNLQFRAEFFNVESR